MIAPVWPELVELVLDVIFGDVANDMPPVAARSVWRSRARRLRGICLVMLCSAGEACGVTRIVTERTDRDIRCFEVVAAACRETSRWLVEDRLESREAHRFDQVSIEPGVVSSLAIRCLTISGDGDELYLRELGNLLHSTRHFIAVHTGKPDIE